MNNLEKRVVGKAGCFSTLDESSQLTIVHGESDVLSPEKDTQEFMKRHSLPIEEFPEHFVFFQNLQRWQHAKKKRKKSYYDRRGNELAGQLAVNILYRSILLSFVLRIKDKWTRTH